MGKYIAINPGMWETAEGLTLWREVQGESFQEAAQQAFPGITVIADRGWNVIEATPTKAEGFLGSGTPTAHLQGPRVAVVSNEEGETMGYLVQID